jgi:hypothetical protein
MRDWGHITNNYAGNWWCNGFMREYIEVTRHSEGKATRKWDDLAKMGKLLENLIEN